VVGRPGPGRRGWRKETATSRTNGGQGPCTRAALRSARCWASWPPCPADAGQGRV